MCSMICKTQVLQDLRKRLRCTVAAGSCAVAARQAESVRRAKCRGADGSAGAEGGVAPGGEAAAQAGSEASASPIQPRRLPIPSMGTCHITAEYLMQPQHHKSLHLPLSVNSCLELWKLPERI